VLPGRQRCLRAPDRGRHGVPAGQGPGRDGAGLGAGPVARGRGRACGKAAGALAVHDRRLTLARAVGGVPSLGSHALWPVGTGLALALLWELGARTRLPAYVPRPSGIAAAFPSVVTRPLFWADALSTCSSIVEGAVVGTVVGAVLGLVMGRVREVGWLLAPVVRSLYSMPLIALVPIMVLWMGYTETARLVAIVIAVVLPVAVSTSDGARLLPGEF